MTYISNIFIFNKFYNKAYLKFITPKVEVKLFTNLSSQFDSKRFHLIY